MDNSLGKQCRRKCSVDIVIVCGQEISFAANFGWDAQSDYFSYFQCPSGDLLLEDFLTMVRRTCRGIFLANAI